MKKFCPIFFLFVGYVSWSTALETKPSQKPYWIKKVPQKIGHRFYVGHSTSYGSQEEGILKATQDAYRQAISENFGIKVKINVKSLETLERTSYSKEISETSNEIKLKGFERKKIHIEKQGGEYNVWVLFRYSLKEIAKEEGRMKKLKRADFIRGVAEYWAGNDEKAKKLFRRACVNKIWEACLRRGLLELNKDNIATARRLFQRSCNKENYKGCHHLGLLEKDDGNIVKAKRAFQKSCKNGLGQSCNRLGVLEEEGGNTVKAEKLYKKACDGGSYKGCGNLGTLLNENDIAKTKKLFQKACEGGITKRCVELGALEHKAGNVAGAIKWYQKACGNGDAKGCLNLGKLESESGNTAKAEIFYQKLCNSGDMEGCNNLGEFKEKKSDIVKAGNLYQKSCDGGYMEGCYNLGMLEQKNFCKKNLNIWHNCDLESWENKSEIVKVAVLYRKACEGGITKACTELGHLEYVKLNSITLEKGDTLKVGSLLDKACNAGNFRGCYLLGELEHLKGNSAKYKKLYKKACDGGYMEGCYSYGLALKQSISKFLRGDSDSTGSISEFLNGNLKAKAMFYKSCIGGHIWGCHKYVKEVGVGLGARGVISQDGGWYSKMTSLADLRRVEDEKNQIAKAKLSLVKGCDNGDMWACSVAGGLERACNGGYLPACHSLGDLEERKILQRLKSEKRSLYAYVSSFFGRKNSKTPTSYEMYSATRPWEKACNGGYGYSCKKLGKVAEENNDVSEAVKWYEKSFMSEVYSIGGMRRILRLGISEQRKGNISSAKRIYKKLCHRGDMDGCHSLGELEYEQGNIQKAKGLFKRVCDSGKQYGCKSLDKL